MPLRDPCHGWNIDIDLGNLDIARPRLAEGIRLIVDTADKSMRQDGIELAMAQGDAARAARMFGTADALRDEVRAQREVLNDRFIQRWIARTRAALGEAAFAAAVAESRALPHDEAVAQTLRWLERPPQDTE